MQTQLVLLVDRQKSLKKCLTGKTLRTYTKHQKQINTAKQTIWSISKIHLKWLIDKTSDKKQISIIV